MGSGQVLSEWWQADNRAIQQEFLILHHPIDIHYSFHINHLQSNAIILYAESRPDVGCGEQRTAFDLRARDFVDRLLLSLTDINRGELTVAKNQHFSQRSLKPPIL